MSTPAHLPKPGWDTLNVERTVAQVATQTGRRVKLRYIGVAKNHTWLRNRCAALNLRTLLRHGLSRTDGAWTTA